MQTRKRVYPSERKPAKWVSYSLLFLSAVILFSGVAARSGGDAVFETVATPSPIPLDAAFDETRETREITLNGSVWYALQLGAFETEEAAGQLAEQFQRRGAAGYLWPEERFRVLAAVYPEKEDAQAVRQQLRDQHDVDSYLFEISIPSVSLRMTGMRGQIDILEAAFLHAEELIRQMERISETLDRQEITPAEAAEELNTLREQVELVALRMEQRFLSPRNAAVTGLIGLMRDYAAFAREKTGQESNALLSRQLKYQTIQTIRLLLELTDELRNT
ncbi:MAG: SPOR domain-containing protein [Candidatus Limiplasma sp.]|nr:SPOR domain-containing protein [Candidatus Limiplasma sp.]MDY4062584.1 SPOR domain-containing protein [Candidatus Limiplasma sp.]